MGSNKSHSFINKNIIFFPHNNLYAYTHKVENTNFSHIPSGYGASQVLTHPPYIWTGLDIWNAKFRKMEICMWPNIKIG